MAAAAAAGPLPDASDPVATLAPPEAAVAESTDITSFTTPVAVTSINPEDYQAQLQAKLKRLETLFADIKPAHVTIEPFQSPPSHYRMRAEFTVYHPTNGQEGELYYVMFDTASPGASAKQPARVRVDTFPVASQLVNELMEVVRRECSADPVLGRRLFQANFHTTLSGDAMVTLLYHRKLDAEWTAAAQRLREALRDGAPSLQPAGRMPQVIGRSRKQKIQLDHDYVMERLLVNGREYVYKQVEGSFSQPNAAVCQHMLSWAQAATAGSSGTDLLELYCGNGNFTMPLAANFRQVVATEVSKVGIDAARHNAAANGVADSVFLARMAAEEFAEAMRGRQQRNRLKGLAPWEELRLQTILVDPPRAGLDDFTIQLLAEFDRIVYVSCNPETLHANLRQLASSHEVVRFAAFDQFPYTHHIECGVLLQRVAGSGA